MYNVIISGVNGSMGQVLAQTIGESVLFRVAAGVDITPDKLKNNFPVYSAIAECSKKADIIIDFSRPAALPANLAFAREKSVPLVIATTGFNEEQKRQITKAAQSIPIFFTANMSLGVNLQIELCRQAAKFFGANADIEIVERHHNLKADAPSGTAMMLAEAINQEREDAMAFQFGRQGLDAKRKPNEIGFHSIRGGRIVGEHCVYFITNEEVLKIEHHSDSRKIFAAGALRAAEFLLSCPAGLYSMHDILGGEKDATNVYTAAGQAVITLHEVPCTGNDIANIFSHIADSNVNLDIINQSVPKNSKVELSFSLAEKDMPLVEQSIRQILPAAEYFVQPGLAKITLEGLGMKNTWGVAAKLFSALAKHNVEILIVTTSETKISFCVDAAQKQTAVDAVRKAFDL